ncbi:PEP-CTERM motif protein [Symmachiella macrocystis]|uniref:PEP-CTERM motif protein n=1 Tax=Symmachiella macrocystis TaxID=2527985 RepID=A0A5C6BVK8_9PLAN|nr:PEP-CTERM sorting domain-containing protein [Symmachiella macrocystis]TWU14734.1 PEP-CTERM motif protein [Symmachiella macrocystis]
MSFFTRLLGVCGVICLLSSPSSVSANSFLFSGSDNGGMATGVMDIGIGTTTVANDTVVVKIQNTSPTTLINGTGVNASAITGFGFNLLDPEPGVFSWTLTAFEKNSNGVLNGTSTVIGGSSGAPSTNPWALDLDAGTGNLNFDYYPSTSPGSTSKGGIYNPDATSGFGGSPHYFSEAILRIQFDVPPLPVLDLNSSPFLRYQVVGNGGSLKLFGTPNDGPDPGPGVVPEPSSFVLFGLGAIGLGAFVRRRNQKLKTRIN